MRKIILSVVIVLCSVLILSAYQSLTFPNDVVYEKASPLYSSSLKNSISKLEGKNYQNIEKYMFAANVEEKMDFTNICTLWPSACSQETRCAGSPDCPTFRCGETTGGITCAPLPTRCAPCF